MQIRFTVMVAFAFLVSLECKNDAWAVIAPAEHRELKTTSGLVSEQTHRRLNRIHALMAEDDLDGALQVLAGLKTRVENRPHEQAQVLQIEAYILAQQGKYAEAVRSFEQCLALAALPVPVTLQTMRALAQVHMATGSFEESLTVFEEYFQYQREPSAEDYVLVASVLGQSKRYQEALQAIDAAIGNQPSPPVNWLQLKLALHFELKDMKNAARVLEQLVEREPLERRHWQQLTGVYLTLEDDAKALAVMELSHKRGYLTEEREILNLVSLYFGRNIPLNAAMVLDEGLEKGTVSETEKNLQLLSQAWLQAQELDKALAALRKAASKSNSGELFVHLAQLYSEKEQWNKAVEAGKDALRKGDLRQTGTAHLVLGVAYVHLRNSAEARQHLLKAASDSKTAEHGQRWLKHMETLLAAQ